MTSDESVGVATEAGGARRQSWRRALRRSKRTRTALARIAVALAQLAAASVIVFALSTLLPGDTAEIVLGQQATPAQIATLHSRLGLDRPVLDRFGDWALGVLTGDLGRSLVTGVPVAEELAERVASTATLGFAALMVIVPLAMVAGVVAGRRPGSVVDRVITATCVAGQAVPEFALGLIFVGVFAIGLGWLPATGAGGSLGGPSVLVLPVAVLVLNQLGRLARQIRIGVAETDSAEYIEHLRRLGLGGPVVLWRHVLPAAVVPSIQQLARVIDGLLAGVVVVEALFALPGVGAGFVAAVGAHDLPLVQGYTLLFATTTVVVNLLADLASVRLLPDRESLS